MKALVYQVILSIVLAIASCGGNNTPSYVQSPGDNKTGTDKILNTGADVLQHKPPLKAFSTYLNGFHFYNGNPQAQMEAHHYVSQLNDDLYQAIIFDGNGPDAKIMGIEYIISARLYKQLPKQEKVLWHSHRYEVKSGELIAPGIPLAAEHKLMEKLVLTYGKTIHTWHTDQDRDLPLGSPMLMMGFTRDGQIKEQLLANRDQRLKVNTEEHKNDRADIPTVPIDPEANSWERGIIRQFLITNNADSAMNKHQMPVTLHREQ